MDRRHECTEVACHLHLHLHKHNNLFVDGQAAGSQASSSRV